MLYLKPIIYSRLPRFFSYVFSSRSFTIFYFTFMSMIHFELIFCGAYKVSTLIFLYVDITVVPVLVLVLSQFSRVLLFVTPWTVAWQAPVSTGFSRLESWSGLPCPSPGNFSNLGTESMSPMSPALAAGFFIASTTWKPSCSSSMYYKETIFAELCCLYYLGRDQLSLTMWVYFWVLCLLHWSIYPFSFQYHTVLSIVTL